MAGETGRECQLHPPKKARKDDTPAEKKAGMWREKPERDVAGETEQECQLHPPKKARKADTPAEKKAGTWQAKLGARLKCRP